VILAAIALAPTYYRGVDASFIPEYRDLKTEFFVGENKIEPLKAFADSGIKLLRLRVWVNPPKGYCNLARTLQMAQEAQMLGMDTLIDFHYSDDWADPQHQITPFAWQKMNLKELCEATRAHTKEVLDALIKQGTPPKLVAIGNEIRNGMMWPLGKLPDGGYDNLSALLKAGLLGAAQAEGKKDLWKTQIHHDSGGDAKVCKFFFDNLRSRGVKYDNIGLSYYPWWHGTFDQLRENLAMLAERYRKPIFVAETAYPFSFKWADNTGNFVWEKTDLKSTIPATPEGQAQFLRELHQVVRATPRGLGAGVIYWAPEYVAQPGMQTPYENLALFDFEHKLLPGARALGER
jgi:arabinogalactan endo-1,4-beta-galactosidase